MVKRVKLKRQDKRDKSTPPKLCPFCGGGKLTPEIVTVTKRKTKRIVQGIFYVWTCTDCGEGFFQNWRFEFEKKK
jgi:YgiT-type zinc finger domain-containing protein